MKTWIKKLLLPALICTAALLLFGCGKKQPDPLMEGESEYQVYYLNSGAAKYVQRGFRTDIDDTNLLVEALIEELLTVPKDMDCQPALSEKVEYSGYRREDRVLYLYFDGSYTGMKADREILCRGAFAKTLTQIPGIDYINIYAGDQPLLDSSGMPVGMLAGSDFIDSISDVNAYEESELTLYFSNEEGDLLVPMKRLVVHSINTSVEQVILQELIAGPQSSRMRPTLDPATRLLNVSVNNNVCYINFDQTFLTNALDVKDYIPVYSIVNSLSELSSVNRVQITVNGAQDVMFRDTISLNQMFERNLDYIRQ